jgi:hypothetical protein
LTNRGSPSVANIFEDGFGIDVFGFGFVLGALIMDVALLALAVVIGWTSRGRYRLLAAIPVGTPAGILAFTLAGGPTMLTTWLAAGAVGVLNAFSTSNAFLGAGNSLTRLPLDRFRTNCCGSG